MNQDAAESAVRDLLVALGQDPSTEAFSGTPSRVARAWGEMLAGYGQDPAEVLKVTGGGNGFDADGYDQMVVVSGIEFWSTCEHHMLPFGGVAAVGYVPNGRVCGLSKLPRLVQVYARRFQLQERMTRQIADALTTHLAPRGVGVRVQARHLCAECRGARQRVQMTTQVLDGIFREHAVRDEFWHLAGEV